MSCSYSLSNEQLARITNIQVKRAIEALQSGDNIWFSLFSENTIVTDNGIRHNFKVYSDIILGNEKFVTIDKVKNGGKEIYGRYKTGQWGVFNLLLKFHQKKDGKFNRLDLKMEQ